MLHAEQRAEDVGVEGVRVALGGLLRDRAQLAFGARVVHGDIATPKRATVLSTRLRTSSSWRTSVRQYSASAPKARSSSANFWPTSSCRPATTARAPLRAKAIAAARPMPVRAPVIKTTGVFIVNSFEKN